jgi:phenylacetate-coenzyme A ligase PaaK-like adenylate-forming protein
MQKASDFSNSFNNRTIIRDYNPESFLQKSLDLFRYQSEKVPVYRDFINCLGINKPAIVSVNQIPFLPIGFFKTHKVIGDGRKEEVVFTSSGTTGSEQSKHYVADVTLYKECFLEGFHYFYGPVKEYCILALLPSYMEREGSSLIFMCSELIKQSGHPDSGFYLYEHEKLIDKLKKLQAEKQKTIMIGVSFALLELARENNVDLSEIIMMETGGMKGREKEVPRAELHEILKKSFKLKSVHSEYGMTELLSQAYSKGEGIFNCPPWMRVLISDIHDPFTILDHGKTGTINIVDLANINSCSFIATSDLGKSYPDGSFEVLGRLDNSDLRGCNLLI